MKKTDILVILYLFVSLVIITISSYIDYYGKDEFVRLLEGSMIIVMLKNIYDSRKFDKKK